MATAIRESIALAIATQLATITVANGYEVTVVDVVRPTRMSDFSPRNLRLLLLQGQRQRDQEIDYQGNPPAIGWRQRFEVVAFVLLSDSSATAFEATLNQVISDIEKAVMADPTWGGLAVNTTLEGEDPIDLDGPASGSIVSFTVQYRVSETSPYVNRF